MPTALTVLGFLIAMTRGADYASVNFQYFLRRHTAVASAGAGSEGGKQQHDSPFLYVDRIVVDDRAQRLGLGRRLYHTAAATAAARGLVGATVCCEVNVRPPNEESMMFHTRVGFEAVGEQEGGHDGVVVAMLEWCPDRAAPAAAPP